MLSKDTKTLISINHATVRYLDNILFPNLTFSILGGENWAVTGKSGSGKTALLQTIMGKYNIVNGHIRYPFFDEFLQEHHIVHPLFSYRNLISYVSFQPHFKNKQGNSDFYYQQRFHAWDAEEAVTVNEYLNEKLDRINEYLCQVPMRFSKDWIIENFKLDYLLDKTLIQLSNGETRRLLLAYAMLQQPKFLLLDNPFTGLDVNSRGFYNQLLTQIAAKNTSLILITSAEEMPDCITHVMHLENGEITGYWQKDNFLTLQTDKSASWQPDADKLAPLISEKNQVNDFTLAVRLKNIHIQYGDSVILDNVNWEIRKGEKWALTGPNGAGKSTLLSLITGDNPQAYANDIILFDKKRGKGESIWDIKAKIGYVSPELHNYFPHTSSCLDVILTGYTDTLIPFRKKITPEFIERAIGWMELLDIENLKDRLLKFISAGEQRLILLIRALIKNPPLLILDEPCQGLDQEQKDHFKNIIEHLCNQSDKTLIYVSHYSEEIPDCVNHFLELDKGHIVRIS